LIQVLARNTRAVLSKATECLILKSNIQWTPTSKKLNLQTQISTQLIAVVITTAVIKDKNARTVTKKLWIAY
jgi:hypothetical protein